MERIVEALTLCVEKAKVDFCVADGLECGIEDLGLKGNNAAFGMPFPGFDHKALAKKLASRTNWILCYNNCDEVLELYGDIAQIAYDIEWKYGMNKSKKSSELLLVNFDRSKK